MLSLLSLTTLEGALLFCLTISLVVWAVVASAYFKLVKQSYVDDEINSR